MKVTSISVPAGALLGLFIALNVTPSGGGVLIGTLTGGLIGGVAGLIIKARLNQTGGD